MPGREEFPVTADNDELVDIDLTNTERELMVQVLNEYAGTAQQAFELMAPVVGRSSEDEWANYVFPLKQAISVKSRCRNWTGRGRCS